MALEDTYAEWMLNLIKSVRNMLALGMTPLKWKLTWKNCLRGVQAEIAKIPEKIGLISIADLLRQGRGKKIEAQDIE